MTAASARMVMKKKTLVLDDGADERHFATCWRAGCWLSESSCRPVMVS